MVSPVFQKTFYGSFGMILFSKKKPVNTCNTRISNVMFTKSRKIRFRSRRLQNLNRKIVRHGMILERLLYLEYHIMAIIEKCAF